LKALTVYISSANDVGYKRKKLLSKIPNVLEWLPHTPHMVIAEPDLNDGGLA